MSCVSCGGARKSLVVRDVEAEDGNGQGWEGEGFSGVG